jgi:hypothetical protein
LERFVVKSIKCKGPEFYPTCLYDFTPNIQVIEMNIYAPADLTLSLTHDYFYGSDNCDSYEEVHVFFLDEC